jgi:hypothetical protein
LAVVLSSSNRSNVYVLQLSSLVIPPVLRVDANPLPSHGCGSVDKTHKFRQLQDTYAILIPNIRIA